MRIVDIPEVFASELRGYLASINGYLFATADGKSLQQRNVLRILHGVKSVGFHAFRRFRLTWLRKNGVPKDLERRWMGHAPEEVGDLLWSKKSCVGLKSKVTVMVSDMLLIEAADNPRPVHKLCHQTQHPK